MKLFIIGHKSEIIIILSHMLIRYATLLVTMYSVINEYNKSINIHLFSLVSL